MRRITIVLDAIRATLFLRRPAVRSARAGRVVVALHMLEATRRAGGL